jgi:hypothetical protein
MNRRQFLKRNGLWIPGLLAFPAIVKGVPPMKDPAFVAGLNKPVAAGGGETTFISSITGGGASAVDAYKGYKFTVGSAAITITQVAAYLAATDGYGDATVQIRATNGSTVLATSVISLAANVIGYYWATLGTPLALSASTAYWACINTGYQSFKTSECVATTTADATINDSAYDNGGTMTAEGSGTGHVYGPVNLKYTI